MSGFFGTFILLVVAMAWSQWLAIRLSWAPRVVYVGGAVWLLSLIFAGASYTGDQSMAALGESLSRMYSAATIALYAAIGTLVALVPVTVMAFLKAPESTEAPPASDG